MENIEQRVRKIIAEQLGVNETEIKNESSFVDDLGAVAVIALFYTEKIRLGALIAAAALLAALAAAGRIGIRRVGVEGRGESTWLGFFLHNVLTDFAKSENLYRIRSRAGKRMESVVEILADQSSNPVDETQLLRERSLRKYLGDYALFMSGIFRSHVEGRGFLDYYIEEGSRSYWTVSELDLSLYRTGFILFQELSKKFEYYSGALDYTRKAYFAAEPGEDPFAGFLRQIEGWMKVNLTEN